MIDLARGTNTRLTFSRRNETAPIWSPDGSRVIYAADVNGKREIHQKLATGSGSEELLFTSDLDRAPADWSQDGRFLLFLSRAPKTQNDIWVLPITAIINWTAKLKN